MRLARRVAQALDLPHVAVDMLTDATGSDLRIIEISSFMQVETPGQLRHDGVPGAYMFDGPGDEYHFVPMRVWPQELALRRVLETRWLARETQVGGEPQ